MSATVQANLVHSHLGAFKFSHQEVGIKQEYDKTDLDHSSPDVFLHGPKRLLGSIEGRAVMVELSNPTRGVTISQRL
jgi:hypothetical protein